MPGLPPEEFARRAAEIEWLLLDADGVLTDGGLYYDRRGHALLKFHVQDGLGIHLARRAGVSSGILSGRESRALERRAAELGIEDVVTGSRDKATDFDSFLERQRTRAPRVAYVGDDLTDLVVAGRCGLSFAPADAAAELRAVVHRVLDRRGGQGAVREVVELLLKARGAWDRVVSPFSFEGGN